LDISFRRSGGLFVILRNTANLHMIVRPGDAINERGRSPADAAFDSAVGGKAVARSVIVELASLDGAVVLNNSAAILAYGAVLRPRKLGRVRGSEGSRTKAAIGASFYGLAVKVSSDGDITVYHRGKEFIRM
jgi:DNA integrity scanning protein DisA with diadenylate cyclase activity